MKKHHLAVDTGHPPMVSVLQIASVCPLEDTNRKGVLSLIQIIGDVEFAWQTAILRVSHQSAVNPHLMSRIDTSEMKYHASSLPVLRNLELMHI